MAVGVDSTLAAAKFLEATFGAEISPREAAAGRSVLVRLDGVCVELVEDPSSEFRGHIAIAVSDLDAATDKLMGSGVQFVGEVLAGAGGSRNLWLSAKASGGLKIHLCERPQ